MGVVLSTVLQLCCLKVNAVNNKRKKSLHTQQQQWSNVKARIGDMGREEEIMDFITVISNFQPSISINFLLLFYTEVIPQNVSSLRLLHEYDRVELIDYLKILTSARIGKIVNNEFEFRPGYQDIIRKDTEPRMSQLVDDCIFVMKKTLTAHNNGFPEEFIRDTVVHGLQVWKGAINYSTTVERSGDFPSILCEKLLCFGYANEVLSFVPTTEDILIQTFGPDHMYVLKLYFNEASAFYLLGNFDDCLSVTANLLEKTSNTIGFENSFSLQVAYLTAKVLEKQENYHDALELYNDIFQVELRKYGADDKRTLSTLHHRANILHKLKVLQESLDLYQNLLKLQQTMFNDGDNVVLNTKARIGLLQEEQGNFKEAFKIYKEIQDTLQCSSHESEKSNNNLKVRNESTISLMNILRRQTHDDHGSSSGYPASIDRSDNFIHLHGKLETRLREEIQLCQSKLDSLGLGDERVVDVKIGGVKNVNKTEQIRAFLHSAKEIWSYCNYFGSISQEYSTFPNQLLDVMKIYGLNDEVMGLVPVEN